MNKHEISSYIRQQFPTAYEEGGEEFVAFVEAYYEFVDLNYFQNRTVLETMDIDNTLEEFILYFKETYLKDFPFVAATSKEFMIKHIQDFYKSKGTELSTQLLLRMLFNEESKINLPSKDILRASESRWYEPEYIEVSRSERTVTFLNKQITGAKSRAKAVVEGIVTKRVEGKYIDVIYLSSVSGKFRKGEFVTDDGNLRYSPQILGSLTKVLVNNGGRDNKIGDIFEVVGAGGERGKVRVSEIIGATGRVDFSIEDGGFGFTTTSDTDVYISDAILFVKNEGFMFENFDIIKQDMEKVDLIAFSNIENYVEIGHTIRGINPSGLEVGNGVVTSITSNGDGSGIIEMYVTGGTFGNQKRVTLTGGDTSSFAVGDRIIEESDVVLSLSSATASIVAGTRIEQFTEVPLSAKTGTLTLTENNAASYSPGEVVVQLDTVGDMVISGAVVTATAPNVLKLNNIVLFKAPNTFVTGRIITGITSTTTSSVSNYVANPTPAMHTNKVVGVVASIAGAAHTISKSWGEFTAGKIATIYANETSTTPIGTCMVDDVNYLMRGATGKVSSKTASVLIVEDVAGEFNTTKQIKNTKNSIKRVISAVANEGATDIRINSNTSANAVITAFANTSAYGKAIGQNSTAVGVWGNTNPFLSSGDVNIPNTTRLIRKLFSNSTNVVTIETETPHGYVAGTTVNISIDLQQNKEIKRIYGIYQVIAATNSLNFTVQMDKEYGDIIRAGGISFYSATVAKTLLITADISREDGTTFVTNVYSLATGFDANFKIGTLEGEETVFLHTDIIGDDNVLDNPYLNIRIDGSDSGIGYVGAIRVNNGGSDYTNGAMLTFTGGGYGNGEPEIVAEGFVLTSGNGVIIDVNITDMGQGYFGVPTITLPVTSGNTASLSALMEFGYGFPKLPEGGIENYLEDLWNIKEMTIGKISSLSEINPGSNYNANPFVFVYNSYIAGFNRTDRIVLDTEGSSMFVVGEQVYQSIPGDGSEILTPKGYVSAITENIVFVKRMSFNTSFTEGYPLLGQSSNASRIILSITEATGSMILGANAIIPAIAISANGIATEVEVIDSGFGYIDEQHVTLYDPKKPYIVTGTTQIIEHGKSEGSWKSTESHLDSNSKIHDNNYYQEFSYEIVTGKSLSEYRNILQNIIHVAGTKMFGKVEKRNSKSVSVTAKSSTFGNYSSFDNTYLRVLNMMFSNGEYGEVLWPNSRDFYSDVEGKENLSTPGIGVNVWRSSVRNTNTNRKNLINWTEYYYDDFWTKTGIFVANKNIQLSNTNTTHVIEQNFDTVNAELYNLSASVKSANISRVTLAISGDVTAGYVTFNISTGSVVATSGGYSGSISLKDGWYKISITNKRMKASNGVGKISIFANSNTGIGREIFTPSGSLSFDLTDIQIERGIEQTSFQLVSHGDEWDGLKFVQEKGAGFQPILSRMPINGVKNILEKSDLMKDVEWDKFNIKVKNGSNISNLPSNRLVDTVDKSSTRHYISRTLNIPRYDNIGFVVRPVADVRYVKIASNGKEAIFDLFTATNISNTFQDYLVYDIGEDGTTVIGVYDTTLQNGLDGVGSKVSLYLMDGPMSYNDLYEGSKTKELDVLRGYVSNSGFKSHAAHVQNNASRYDVSSSQEEDRWYVKMDTPEQRFISQNYIGSLSGQTNVEPIKSYLVAGVNGIWYEEIADTTFTYFPSSYEIVKAMDGVMGLVMINRLMTTQEIEYLVDIFKNNGSKGKYQLNMTNISPTLSGFTNSDATTSANELITLTSSNPANVYRNIGRGLYYIKFDYEFSANITNFTIASRDSSGNITPLRNISTANPLGVFEETLLIENSNLNFNIIGSSGSTAKITNIIIRRYDVV